MYETEANSKLEPHVQIPPAVISGFSELKGKVLSRTVLPWSEHCTECVWPTCYTSCDLYSPREDGRCRRFADGMVRIDCPEAVNGYVLKIRFKRWGKLWTPGNVRLHSVQKAIKIEKRDYHIGRMLYHIPVPAGIKKVVTNKRYSFKKRMANRHALTGESPNCFLVECFNPGPRDVRLSLTMRSVNKDVKIPFQQLIELTPGFHLVRIPFEEISRVLDVHAPFNIELIPDEGETETTLYFGLMEFVRETAVPAEKSKNVKCVIWDLDNTLWDGVLVEDGMEKLQLKPEVVEVIQTLDSRGILNSIASKNNAEDALVALRKFQIEQYFLYPQISWQPKSEAIGSIARALNIGTDTLLFVDDSEFELDQVRTAHPEVRVVNAKSSQTIADLKDCQVITSSEAKSRRIMYLKEAERQNTAQSFGQDYMAFLRHCQIKLNIYSLQEENLERVHELTQRTNQMNFSGNRYDRHVLRKIMNASFLETYVLDCEDRFGSYGVIGFCIVDDREPRLTDLMFSCRIQSKRVEHAFLAHIVREHIKRSGADFHANYRKTPRNEAAGRVFADLGFTEAGDRDGFSSFIFSKEREVPDDGIVAITVCDPRSSLK